MLFALGADRLRANIPTMAKAAKKKRPRKATRKKLSIEQPGIRLRVYPLLCDLVEIAVRAGYRRAHKHTEKPSEETVIHEVHQRVMNELSELFIFPEDYPD